MRRSWRERRSPLASVRRSDSRRNIRHFRIDSPNESECSNCLIQHVFGILARNRTVGIVLLVLAIIPFGDMSNVLASDGRKVTAFSVHGITCAVMLFAGLLLIHAV